MNILILGSNGQLGIELKNTLKGFGEILALSKKQLNIGDENSIREIFSNFKPDYIINSAAFTKVEEAESNAELSFKVNSEYIGILAKEAAKINSKLIHFSTDYVFDGLKIGKYSEKDETNPLNIYGRSKLMGENLIKQSNCFFYIFRTTWVVSENGTNFAKTIFNLIKTKKSLNVISDQIGVPTSTELIARVVKNLIISNSKNIVWEKGIYNITPKGKSNWYEVARYLFDIAHENNVKMSLDKKNILPILTKAYSSKVKRPLNSLLDISKVERMIDFSLPKWEDDFYGVVIKLIKGNV